MKRLFMILLTAALCLNPVAVVWAEEGSIEAGGWVDLDKGPGVARWLDENGREAEPPGTEEDLGPSSNESMNSGEGYGDTGQEGEIEIEENASNQEEEKVRNQEGAEEERKEAEEQENTGEEGAEETGGQESAGEERREEAGNQENMVPAKAQESASQSEGGSALGRRWVDPSKPMVALTFDDGPYAPVGNQIMNCLAQYGGKATFYVVGSRCSTYRAEMQRMAAEGHEIGNHTYEHKLLDRLGSAAQIRAQIDMGAAAIQEACGIRPSTVRLPGGNKNSLVLAAVQEPIVLWSLDTMDWKTRNTQQTVNRILNSVRDGDVILMHELYPATANAMLQVIPELHRRGFQLVTVSEMAQYRGGLQNGRVYTSFR
ncbi:polysaccharide deacetylase family protein [Lachnospiraceae bacterium 62-35]